MEGSDELFNSITRLRAQTPLVHTITNYVTINDLANSLLALGASPAMVESAQEAYGFSTISSAVYLNLGTLTDEQKKAMLKAVEGAMEKNVPVIIDPVAAGAIPSKVSFVEEIRKAGKLSVVKGNLGEIKTLVGMQGKTRGVDSIDEGSDAAEACSQLAREWNCVVVASGKQDTISNGSETWLVDNGSSMLQLITGSGCMLGALVAAFCGAGHDYLQASVAACISMGVAGEGAEATEKGKLPGSFRTNLIDQLYLLNATLLKEKAKVSQA
mgnify:CR=1 FL=1